MKKKEVLLDKGDVLFWHPLLFHGSSSQKVEGYSRKSLTAHYFPIDYLKGGGGLNTDENTQIYRQKLNYQKKFYRNYGFPIYATKRRRDNLIFSIKGLLHFILNKNEAHTLMNRKNYE